MRLLIMVFLISLPIKVLGAEWKNLKSYQKETHQQKLSSSDWLTYDRKHNTAVWQNANRYNLTHNKPEEYKSLKQRSDFYKWLYVVLKDRDNEVVWPAMASFISKKLHVMQQFPQCLLVRKKVKIYAQKGSESVFNNAFEDLNSIYSASEILSNKEVVHWDETLLYKEQYDYLQPIYKKMNKGSLHQIERIAKGKFIYAIVVPKEIRFNGDIANPTDRFQFAQEKLKPFCKNLYQ